MRSTLKYMRILQRTKAIGACKDVAPQIWELFGVDRLTEYAGLQTMTDGLCPKA